IYRRILYRKRLTYFAAGGFMQSDLEGIEGRLARLERQSRRQRKLGAIALIALAVLFAMGQAPSKKTVEANEFILRDDNRNVRVRLTVNPKRAHGAPEMLFFDDQGNPRLFLDGGLGAITDSGGGVAVYDGQGKPRGFFTATASGGAVISMWDPARSPFSD